MTTTPPIEGLDVVVLAYNEAPSLELAVKDIHEALSPLSLEYRIIIVDDGSTDETIRIASRLAARDPLLVARSHVRNKGMGAALRTGISASTLPHVTMLPGDRQIRAHVLPSLIELAGPRTVVTSLYTNRPNDALRTLTSRTFRLFLHAALGPLPPLEGTYIVPRDLLDDLTLTSETFTIAFEIFHHAQAQGYAFQTAHIPSHARDHGTSRVFNPRRIAKVASEVLRLGWKLR